LRVLKMRFLIPKATHRFGEHAYYTLCF
jgi:hypothetical protein